MTVLQQEQAKACLRELVKHTFEHSLEDLDGLTYQELALRIGRLNKHDQGHGHGMGAVLGSLCPGFTGKAPLASFSAEKQEVCDHFAS